MKRAAMPQADQDALLARVGAWLREAGFERSGDDPVEATIRYDRTGRVRKIHARYPCGWRATLVIRADGTGTLSTAKKVLSLRVESRPGETL
ncbi:hypothetical protein ACFQ1E_07920 [Sphingomonas canadensis]|uniref:Uncharacterized protein n=1 Tax=Sphingomonas canadensis TaxID=1219257 RepID=A0ABW3H487_9SPHN|nr:hypothetical protein [Sphingomonas canadensis]MCW3835963.1 hypothetical protein [Sphingomonas canadensis]